MLPLAEFPVKEMLERNQETDIYLPTTYLASYAIVI